MIKLTQPQWAIIEQKLKEEYPPSVMLLRYKMKEVLGFVVRNHHEWVVKGYGANEKPFGHYRDWVMLDFYNNTLETFFRLKYIDVNGPSNEIS